MADLKACGNNDLETFLLFNNTAGSPVFTNTGLNGADLAAITLASSDQAQVYMGPGAPTNDVVFGFYYKQSLLSATKFFSWEATNTDVAFSLYLDNSGNVDIYDNSDTVVANGSGTPLSDTDWHLIEFVLDQATSTTGTLTVYVDGVSAVSTSSQNFTTTGNANKARWHGPTSGTRTIGAWYCFYNSTAGVSDFIGDFEVRTLQGDGNTTGGNAWDSGTWANVSETPYNGSNTASFTQNAALSNYREDQGGSRAGPNGVSGIGTIYGITYCTIADRGGGSGAGNQKDLLGGNSVDGTTNLLSMNLSTSPTLYTVASESASVVPTASEYSRIGFAHNGARDMNIFEAWSSLLYAPSSGSVTVPVTGVAGTGNVGSVTVATDQVIAVTGLQATGNVGTVTVVTDQVIAVTGLEATGQVGSVNVALGATVPVTGLEATGGVGSVTVATDQVIAVTGLEATGQVGTVAVSIPVDVAVTGLEATGQVGTVDVTFGITVPVTGLEATGNVGSVNVTTDQVIAVTGQEATGELGTVTVLAGIIVPVTGLEAIGNVGTATALPDTNVSVTGLQATGEVGTAIVSGDIDVLVTGLEATGSVGTVTVLLDIVVSVTGLEANGNVGTVTVTADGLTVVTGLEATGFVGTATAITDQVIAVTGLQATGQVGSVTVDTGDTIIFVTGLEADGEIGDAFGLGVHVPSQNPNWVEIRP